MTSASGYSEVEPEACYLGASNRAVVAGAVVISGCRCCCCGQILVELTAAGLDTAVAGTGGTGTGTGTSAVAAAAGASWIDKREIAELC